MIDPVTVIGGIGFGLSVISFLADTATSAVTQLNEIKRCETNLNTMKARLQNCEILIMEWKFTWWGKNGFSEDKYIYCWGEEGYKDIDKKLKALVKITSTIRGRLNLTADDDKTAKKQLGKLERLQWGDILQSLSVGPGDSHLPRSFFRKVIFTLVNNELLQKDLSMLKDLAENLRNVSRKYFREQQKADIRLVPTKEELDRLIVAKTWMPSLFNFANELFSYYHSDQNVKQSWDLEIRPPDPDGDATQEDAPATINIDFFVQHRCRCGDETIQRLRVEHRTPMSGHENESGLTLAKEIANYLYECQKARHEISSMRQFRFLASPKKFGLQARELFDRVQKNTMPEKILQTELLTVALGLANWTILLWGTPWSLDPCTCKLRRTVLNDNKVQYRILSCLGNHIKPICFAGNVKTHQFFKLGRVLAELVLCTPLVIIEEPPGQLKFLTQDSTLTRAGLLQQINRAVGNIGIYTSIKRCFELDDIYPEVKEVRVEHLQSFAEEIVRPIQCRLQAMPSSQSNQRWRRERNESGRIGLEDALPDTPEDPICAHGPEAT